VGRGGEKEMCEREEAMLETMETLIQEREGEREMDSERQRERETEREMESERERERDKEREREKAREKERTREREGEREREREREKGGGRKGGEGEKVVSMAQLLVYICVYIYPLTHKPRRNRPSTTYVITDNVIHNFWNKYVHTYVYLHPYCVGTDQVLTMH